MGAWSPGKLFTELKIKPTQPPGKGVEVGVGFKEGANDLIKHVSVMKLQ